MAHADCAAEDLDVLIVSSITHYVSGLRMQLEPPLREAIELCLLIGNYQGLASTIGGLGIQIDRDPGRKS